MSIEIPLSIKYRPKKLSEVIGQPVIVKAFTNAFKNKTLHHAYILAGAYGTGKTTTARIVAAMDNCEKTSSLEPCGKCRNCQEIFEGKSFDVREIDAASNRGIDDVRAIHKNLYSSPIQCKVKYVLIDEVHSLTGYAAEAALKMIEEPPDHTRFILCTTDPHKLKDTIHSRCILWAFNKVSWTEIYNHLCNISKKENLEYEEMALKTMAKMAKGSVRDSLQNLQTVVNYVGSDKITDEQVREALGTIDEKLYFDLIEAILSTDILKCYQIIDVIFRTGKEAGIVINDMYSYLNNLLKAKFCKNNLSDFSLTEEEIKRYIYQANKMKGELILKIMNLMNKVGFSISVNLNPRDSFDQFVVEAVKIKVDLEEKVK